MRAVLSHPVLTLLGDVLNLDHRLNVISLFRLHVDALYLLVAVSVFVVVVGVSGLEVSVSGCLLEGQEMCFPHKI